MIRLILLITFVLIVMIVIQQVKNTPKAQKKQLLLKITFATLALILLVLAVTGRIHWVGALLGALLPAIQRFGPWLIKIAPFLQHLHRKQSASASHTSSGQASSVSTRFLDMTLDHDSQQLSGRIREGLYAGSSLDSLELEQLQQLLEYYRQQGDQDSCQLLANYLGHRFGNRWQQTNDQSNQTNDLSLDEAYQILGLKPGASREEISKAHKRLMQKLHPDRGGNDYLAAKLNQAKDLLLRKVA